MHRIEVSQLAGVTIGSLDGVISALQAELVVEVRWHGAGLDSLIDRAHAALVTAVAERLQRAGWITQAEVSFNHYGDRGRCDLVAWRPADRVLLIVEVKTRLGNLQEMLGSQDVKTRLGREIAEQLGLGPPRHVAPALVLVEHGGNRRLIRTYEALFRRYAVRGRRALAWLRRPESPLAGLLWFEPPPHSGQGGTKRPRGPSQRPPAG